MIQDVARNMDLAILGRTALVLFVLIFLAIIVYAATRSRRQVEHWSRIPLEGESAVATDSSPTRTQEPRP